MTMVEAALETLVFGVLLPVAAAAIDPVLVLSVLLTCLVVKSQAVYLVAPIVGVAAYALAHGRLFVSDGFESVMRFGWVLTVATGAVVVAFILRTVFRRYFTATDT